MSTDGRRSFAIYVYDNPASLPSPHHIGFNAGDGRRFSNIEADTLESVNVFRIDGMCSLQ